MQKNKTLPIFLLDSAPDSDELNSLSALESDRVVVFGLYGIEESFKMESMLEEKHKNKVFFVHMSDSAFKRAKAEEFSDKVDFSFYHFFYDIFKVDKFNFKKSGFTHLSWVKGLDLDKMNKIINTTAIADKETSLIIDNPESPNSGGSLMVGSFERVMDKNIFASKDEVVTNGN